MRERVWSGKPGKARISFRSGPSASAAPDHSRNLANASIPSGSSRVR